VAKARAKPQAKGTKSRNPVIRYFQETRDELRKVTWPGREEAWRLTLIVLGVTLAFMIFLGALDFLFQQLAGLLLGL
jgi:preprotein translocase subunit SecE